MDNTFYNELCKKEETLVEKLRVLREFKNKFFDNPQNELVSSFVDDNNNARTLKQLPTSYSNSLAIWEKVLFSLKEIEQGEVQQIASKLILLEPNYGIEKAKKDVKQHVSKLFKNGIIDRLREGSGKRSGLYAYKK